MGFGLTFAATWIAADEAAKAVAGTIAVGARVVGEVPMAMAALEDNVSSGVQTTRETITRSSLKVQKTVAVTSTQWSGWMDVKAAQVLQDAGLPVDANAEAREAALDNIATQQEWEQKQAASDASLRGMREKVEQANAQRSAAAQQLKQKIVGKGKAAADAINKARKSVDALAVKGLVRGVFAVKDLYQAVKAKFTKAPVNSPEASCPDTNSPANQLRNRINSEEELLKDAKDAVANRGPNAAKLTAAIPALEKQIDVNKKALLAADVYDAADEFNATGKYESEPDVAPGCDRLGDAEIEALGLNPNDFHPAGSEFRAAIYKCGDRFTLVYKGTTATSEQDWENNALQGLGLESDYYSRAQQLAQRVYAVTGDKLDIVGHSLGGGLASAAVASIGDPNVRGTTYNAAGLSPDTVPDADLAQIGKQIDVYQVDGEPLTTAQAYTSKLGLSPQAMGTPHPLPSEKSESLVDKHSMEGVERGLLQQKPNPDEQVQSLLGASAVATP